MTGTLGNGGELAPAFTNFSFTDNGGLEIDGTLKSLPNTTFLLQFFATPIAQQSTTAPQGEILLNATPLSITTDSSGNASFAATGLTVVGGNVAYTATATDSSGNTSDYTPPDDKVEQQPPSGSVDLSLVGKALPSPAAQNGQLTYEFTVTNKGPYEATGILFTDTLPAGVTLVSITPSQGSVTGTSADLVAGRQPHSRPASDH